MAAPDYTEARVVFDPRSGGQEVTFPATSVVITDGVMRLDSDTQTTLIPINDLVRYVVLR